MAFYKQDPQIKHKYSYRKGNKFRYVNDDRAQLVFGIRIKFLMTEDNFILLTEDGKEILIDG